MTATKCFIILSEKSSGSSACQKILAKFGVINHVANTRHHENETLYWTKAASIRELPQLDMIDSEVPIAAQQARVQLIDFLRKNTPDYEPPEHDRELIEYGNHRHSRGLPYSIKILTTNGDYIMKIE